MTRVVDWFPNAASAGRLCLLLAATGQAIAGMELLANRRMFAPFGLLDWHVWRTLYSGAGIRAAVSWLPSGAWFVVLLGTTQMIASMAVAVQVLNAGDVLVPLTIVTVANVLAAIRIPVGLSAANRMMSVVLAAMLLAELSGTSHARHAALTFIALQASIAYAGAGYAKVRHKGWYDGTYLRELFATAAFGHRAVIVMFRRWPPVAAWLGRFIVAFECVFPVVVILPPPVAAAVLACGLCFHVCAALAMGLNTFVWAFTSSYPAILFLNSAVRARLFPL